MIQKNLKRMLLAAVILCATAAVNAYGQQDAKLRIDQLNYLTDKAVEIVDVTLDKNLIELAAKFIPGKTPDEVKIKELLLSIQGVYVKRFAFENEGTFTDSDANSIRSQLQNPAWTRIVSYVNKKKDGNRMNVEVFLMTQGSVIKGLAALATETKAITVVNLVGPIDLDKLSQLEGRFGIPNIGLKQTTGVQQQDEADTTTKKAEPNKKP